MGKTKKLLKNTAIFSISQFASKLLNFLLIPFYTNYLTTTDYGIADYINTIVVLLIAILPLFIQDAVLRFSFSKKEEIKSYFTIGVLVTTASVFVFLLGLPIYLSVEFLKNNLLVFILTYVAYTYEQLTDNFLQAINKIIILGITGIIKTVVIILLNIFFIVFLKMGVNGYLYSYVIGILFVLIVKVFVSKIWSYFSLKKFSLNNLKEMLKYSIPIVPNSIGWWLTNSLNKIILTSFCTVSDLGLYTVASKIPTILSTLQSMTSSALNLSVFEEYSSEKKEENNKYYSKVFSIFSLLFGLATSMLITFTKMLAGFMFKSDFYVAWAYVPMLLIGSFFGILSGFLGTFYFASMKTIGAFITTIAGAVTSIVFNIVLIPLYGINGTIIATSVSGLVILLLRMYFVLKNKYISVSYLVLIGQILLLCVQAILTQLNYNCYIVGSIIISLVLILNIKNILEFARLFVVFYKRRNKV